MYNYVYIYIMNTSQHNYSKRVTYMATSQPLMTPGIGSKHDTTI